MKYRTLYILSLVMITGLLLNLLELPRLSAKHESVAQAQGLPVLTTKSQVITLIKSALAKRQTGVAVHIKTREFNWDQLGAIINQAVNTSDDYDHYNYLGASWHMKGYTKKDFNLNITFRYMTSKAQEDQISARIKQVMAVIVKPGMSEDRKVKNIHDWVVKNVKYDETIRERSAYAGFFRGKTVCQGYSLMMYKMLKTAGVYNRIIVNQKHAWNVVRINNRFYHLDATWDDPTPDRGPNYVRYDYFNLSESELHAKESEEKDKIGYHNWNPKTLPAANTHYYLENLYALLTDVNSLNWQVISSEPATAITKSLVLPLQGKHGSSIRWKSSNPAISAAGVVTRPAPNRPDSAGTLTAYISKPRIPGTREYITETLTFQTRVLKNTEPPPVTSNPVPTVE